VSGAGEALRTAARGLGQALITVGVVLLLFCVYELYITGLYTDREQKALGAELSRQWDGPVAAAASPGEPAVVDEPVPGGAYARLYVPRLYGQASRTVVEGVEVPDLKKGPGHLPESAAPGELGNTVISGHRTTYSSPFADLDRLVPGDAVVVETRTAWLTYRATGSQVVSPSAVEVTYPVPGQRGAAPTERLLTLTTCNPKYSARQRLVVRAVLESSVPRSPGVRPPALQGV
jgi:sortase A